jgi:hypothetical protein
MLSHEAKIQVIADIIHEHLKGKHKDRLSKELAEKILQEISDDNDRWFDQWVERN